MVLLFWHGIQTVGFERPALLGSAADMPVAYRLGRGRIPCGRADRKESRLRQIRTAGLIQCQTCCPLIFLAEGFYNGLDEVPYGRFQPLVVQNTHIQRLVPVFQWNIGDARTVFHALIGDEADAEPGAHQIQCGVGRIHRADHGGI